MNDQSSNHTPISNVQLEQELRHLNDEWVRALVEKDGETLSRVMADDCIFTHPLEGDDTAQFVADVTSGDLTVEYLQRENVRVRIYGSTAVLTGRDTSKWLYKGREMVAQYKTIHVYAERGGRWQIVAIQACPMAH